MTTHTHTHKLGENIFNHLQHISTNISWSQSNPLIFSFPFSSSSPSWLQEVDALKLAANFGKLCIIPLDHILVHNIALQFFMGNCRILSTNKRAEKLFLNMFGYWFPSLFQKLLNIPVSFQTNCAWFASSPHFSFISPYLIRQAVIGSCDRIRELWKVA